MFTQTVEYALRIAVCLASSDPKPRTADELARATHVPRAYLAKVIQAMVRGGTARSKRGVGGGVALAKSSEELTLLDVINSVDPIKRLGESPVSENGECVNLDGLNRRFERALKAVEQVFGEATLAEVVADGRVGEGEPLGSEDEIPRGATESNGHGGVKSMMSPVAVGNVVGAGHHQSGTPGMV